MTKNVYVQATKFIREIVQAKKKATSKDVENFVEMLKTLNAPLDNLEFIRNELDIYVKNKVIYFQRTQNKSKEEEYIKIRKLMSKFFDFYINKKVSN